MTPLDTLLPLFGVAAYFLGALAVFQIRLWLGHPLEDAEVSERPASIVLGRYWRHYMMWVLSPFERLLARLHVSPSAITFASLVAAVGSALCLSRGRFGAGGWLYLVTGMLDILDGRVARATGRVSRAGAFFDSVIDRYAELAVLSGLAIYYRDRWVLAVALAAAVGSVMVSYVRARGEALGVDVKVGTMQRPERLFYLGLMVCQSPAWEALFPSVGKTLFAPAVAALLLLGASANVTALRRIRHTLRALDPRGPDHIPCVAEERPSS